ncbi:MAG: RsiV family protein [Candidatus Paceibacterota bacterium]
MKKSLMILIILLAIGAGAYYLYKQSRPIVVENTTVDDTKDETPISIATKEIREENYMGSKPEITGTTKLAITAREYIEQAVKTFGDQANADVPAMREEFGPDSPTASYSIEIQASLMESANTESIIISEYVYSGGAHGSSSYRVLTASKENGEILTLSDIVKQDKQGEFTSLVKNKLIAWRPSGSGDAPVVFPEDVANLTFYSFTNWALNDENLIIYFSQYEVGPGVLGAFGLPITLSEIKDLLL